MRDMLGREDAIPVHEAQRLLFEHINVRAPSSTVRLSIDMAYKRVLSGDILSSENLPAFSRSTVDGYSVISSDTYGASEGLPAYLNLTGEILMGEEPSFVVKRGDAVKIATGGMLPGGSDAVVMFEYTQHVDGGLIEVLKPAAPGENVISAGEDIKKGELVLARGSTLRPQDIAALAALGITLVDVYDEPRVSIISTGDEIVTAESLLKPGQVRDVNSYNLFGLTKECGAVPVKKGLFKDSYDAIRDVVSASLEDSDMVIITGGSSVGTKDMTHSIIDSLGSPGVLFHGVALKPGKPTIGGVIGGKPVFGLPGHPAAVTVCFELFVRPVIRRLTGAAEDISLNARRSVHARIAKNISSGSGREEHIRVSIEDRSGELWAVPVLGKSGLIRTLVKAAGVVVLPPHVRGIQEGDTVEVILF